MSMFDALRISATGLTAERTRMDVASANLANADSTNGANGQPYRRQEVVLQSGSEATFASTLQNVGSMAPGVDTAGTGAGVRVAGIVNDPSPNRLVYDPTHPDANKQGYVSMPNVNPVIEMTDLIGASRAYEANTTAIETTKTMFTKLMDLLK